MSDTLQDTFTLELLRLALHDRHVQSVVVSFVKPNFLQTPVEKKFFLEFRHQIEIDKHKPTFGTLKQAFRKEEDVLEYIEQVEATELRDPDSITGELENYVKESMFVELYDKSADLYNRGNKKAAYTLMNKGAEKLNGFSLTHNGFDPLFKTFVRRQADRMMSRDDPSLFMPIGIDELDYLTGGGPSVGEFVLWLGDSKGTKSFALIHCGVNYARKGYRVAHIQAEGTDKQVKDRYDACWSGSLYSEIKSGHVDDVELFNKYKKTVSNLGDGEIFIYTADKFNSLTMLEIRQKIIDLKKKHDVKVVIIDYLELVNPDNDRYTPGEEKQRQQKVSRMMKDMARELGVLVISATQASSVSIESLEQDAFVLRRENLSDDKGKVRPVDMLLTLNRTSDEAKSGTLRIFCDAMRDNTANHIVKIKQNLKRSRFYDKVNTMREGFFTAS